MNPLTKPLARRPQGPLRAVWTPIATPLGPMVLAGHDQGLQGAWFEGQKHFAGPPGTWERQDTHPVLAEAGRQLAAWFQGRLTRFDLPLAPQGTAFQCAVWQAIAEVDFGATREYGQVAERLGQPGASRAVGAATGRNPLSIIVPCHRLLGRGGALTGYAGGLPRKQALLRFEAGAAAPRSLELLG